MNRERADALLQWLKANKKRWQQGHWTSIPLEYFPGWEYAPGSTPKEKGEEGHTINCGTTACVAGHAAFMFGPVNTKYFREALITPDGAMYTYSEYARKVLELDSLEAEYLFYGGRDFSQIEEFLTANSAVRQSIIFDDDDNGMDL